MTIEAGIWLILAAVLFVLEGVTIQLVSIWFAIGALVSMIFALLDMSLFVQIIGFTVTSAILLAVTRPVARSITTRRVQPTNADRLIGQIGIVVKTVGGGAVGEVKAGGLSWSAVPNSDFIAEPGQLVSILSIDGVKLVIAKLNQEAEI